MVNPTKTETMISNVQFLQDSNQKTTASSYSTVPSLSASYPSFIIQLNNKTVQNTEQFRYLGAQIRFDNTDAVTQKSTRVLNKLRPNLHPEKDSSAITKLSLLQESPSLTPKWGPVSPTAANAGQLQRESLTESLLCTTNFSVRWSETVGPALKAQVIMTRISDSNGQPRNSTLFAPLFLYLTS